MRALIAFLALTAVACGDSAPDDGAGAALLPMAVEPARHRVWPGRGIR